MLFFLSLVFMIRLSPPLTAVALVTVPALLVMALRLRKVVYPAVVGRPAAGGRAGRGGRGGVTGVRVVKGFGQEGRELRHLAVTGVRLFGARMRNACRRARQAIMQTVPALAQVAVLASAAGWP